MQETSIQKRVRVKESKKRLVWSSELHRRFEQIVLATGIKSSQPRIILRQMSVEGLTRENIASHLQKFRHRVMKMHGLTRTDQLQDHHGDYLVQSSSRPMPTQRMSVSPCPAPTTPRTETVSPQSFAPTPTVAPNLLEAFKVAGSKFRMPHAIIRDPDRRLDAPARLFGPSR